MSLPAFSFAKKQAQNTPIIEAIAGDTYKAWLKRAGSRTRQWLESNGYEGQPETHIALPGSYGRIDKIIAIYNPKNPRRCFSALAEHLPAGKTYALASRTSVALCHEAAIGWGLGAYRFDRYRQAKEKPPVLVFPAKADKKIVTRYLDAITLVRDLINIPAIDLGPAELAEEAKKVAEKAGAEVKEIVGKALIKQNYPAIYTVGMASPRDPRLVDITWGNPKHPKVTLVGKGVIYDTGGLSLKTGNGMLLMKKDMGGAAHALAVLQMVADARLPIRLRVLLPLVENAVAGNAYRPGDIINSRSGKTIEITNTDAEGRLIMADCLYEGAQEKPDYMVDFATLTGASRVAVGHELASYMSNDRGFQNALLDASEKEKDRIWPLPLHADYKSQLASKVADINHCPLGGLAGAITAGLFLEDFLGENPSKWAHIDTPGWNKSPVPGHGVGGDAFGVWALFGFLSKTYGKKG